MKVRKGLLAMGLAAALMTTVVAAPRADAAGHFAGQRFIGPRFVGPRLGFYYGPAYGWYSPYGPGYAYLAGPPKGEVKVQAQVKGESIYVDGGYAGVTGKLKKFSLQPGNHQIEVKDATGKTIFQNTLHIIAGQTIDINC